MNKLIKRYIKVLILVLAIFIGINNVYAEKVTITYDLNEGTCDPGCVLSEEVEVGTEYELPGPVVPEVPIVSDVQSLAFHVYPPEGKWFAAFEINGKEFELGAEIEITEDTTIKYLYKDMVYIHRVDITLDAPIVGSEVAVEKIEFDDYSMNNQKFGPSIEIPDNDLYYIVYEDSTYWYDKVEDGKKPTYFEGKIEKNTKYKAFITVDSTDRGIEFADDLKVFVNGKEVTDFETMDTEAFIFYEIESVEDLEEYTFDSPTETIDVILSFIEQSGEIYSFDIKEYLSITYDELKEEIDFWNQYIEEEDNKISFEEAKAEFDKIINYARNAASGKGNLLKLYDLYLTSNGDYIHEVEGGFNFKIKITDDIKGYNTYKLIYIADDGTTEDAIDLKINGEYLEGTLPHLSLYALVGSNTESVKNPKTKDNILVYISLSIVSIIAIISTLFYIKKVK